MISTLKINISDFKPGLFTDTHRTVQYVSGPHSGVRALYDVRLMFHGGAGKMYIYILEVRDLFLLIYGCVIKNVWRPLQ
jgi:hypothetical protein